MKDLFYYSIFAVILYFVLTAIFDNFTLEQENFDPSLVPVSSIITLAKVAQKLVNGNGTLTNPGNLQIGSSASAPGNLTVTGKATVGNGIMSTTIVPGTASPDSAIFTFGDGSGWRTRFGKAGSPTMDIYDNGTVNITGTLNVGGTNIVKIITDAINSYSSAFTTNSLTVKGNASVTGDLTVRGTNILDTINGAISTLGNSFTTNTLTVKGNTNVTGTLMVRDTDILTSINNATNSFTTNTLKVTGNTTIAGTLTVGNTDVIDKINTAITTQITPLIAKNTELTKQITDLQAIVNGFNSRSGTVAANFVSYGAFTATVSFSQIKATSIILYSMSSLLGGGNLDINLSIQPGIGFTFSGSLNFRSTPINWFVAVI